MYSTVWTFFLQISIQNNLGFKFETNSVSGKRPIPSAGKYAEA